MRRKPEEFRLRVYSARIGVRWALDVHDPGGWRNIEPGIGGEIEARRDRWAWNALGAKLKAARIIERACAPEEPLVLTGDEVVRTADAHRRAVNMA